MKNIISFFVSFFERLREQGQCSPAVDSTFDTAHVYCAVSTVVGKQAKVAILTICPSELRALQGKKWLRKTTRKVASIGL